MRSMIQDKEPPPSYIVLKGASSLGSRRLDKEGKRGTATGSSVDFLPSIQSSSNEMASQEKVESSPGQWTFLDEEVEEQQERACFLRGLLFGLYICLSIGLSFGVPLLSSDSPPRACFIGIFVSLSFVTLGYLGYLYDRCVQTQLKLVKIHAKASCASISKKNRQRYQQPNRNTYAENYEVSKKDEQSETERAPSPAKHTASHQSDSRSKDDLRGSFSQVGGTDEAERGGKASPNEDRVMPIKEASFSAKRRISLSSTASPASGSVSKGTSYPSCSFMTARSVPLKRYLCDELNNIIIQGSSSGPSSTSSPTLKRPIAESFTNATVLVAHISGFTAFCSERDASQIFILLENIWERFDGIAKRLGVFKVDTISSSYMAVTGVPEEQPDHAVRMAKFARQIQRETADVVKPLERILGPGTADLRLRIGLHSGSVTAGFLRNEKRFQIFGDTVNIAQSIESSSRRNRILISSDTAELLKAAKKGQWIQKCEDIDPISTKNKGTLDAYWLLQAGDKGQLVSTPNVPVRARSVEDLVALGNSDAPPSFPRRGAVETYRDNFILALPPMSRSEKTQRLIDWVVELLANQLRNIKAQRDVLGVYASPLSDVDFNRTIPIDSIVEAIKIPKFDPVCQSVILRDNDNVNVDPLVLSQLRALVTRIAHKHRSELPFHNFEHGCHCTMGVSKFLKQIVTPKEEHYHDDDIISDDPNHFIYGVTSNAVTQFAILFAAAVHDIDHKGLENTDLAKMNPKIASKFKNRCIAEQHSVETAFNILMKDEFKELQQAIFADDEELKRVRQIVTNSVLATDFDDEQNKAFRDQRWANAFRNSRADDSYTANLKATAVLEVLLQVADISYATQHWKVFQKWNEQHFREQMMAFDAGRQSQDPSDSWYEQVLSFLDTDVIPVAQKLKECGIVGVASDECLGFASDNRREWAQKGKDLVQAMAERYQKRKEMEIAGFTAEEVGNFSHKELEFIIKKLVEKGRSNGTKKVDSVKGQNDAAQAWMDALEIYEQAPAASELSDRSIIFPVYSGVYAWLKGGKIDPSVVDNFEQNLAHKFVRESKLHDVGSVHSMRALAMLCEVTARAGDYKNAFNFLAVIKSMYEPEKHSLKLDEIYGTDRVAHAFAQSATWYEQMGDHDKALETCENAMKNLLPALDPTNTLGIFEFLLPILRVLKSQGQTERCYLLFSRHVDKAFREFHGEDEFTPTKSLHKPMLWLFGMCHDPDGFEEFDEVVRWLSHDDNGIPSDFLDTIMAQTTWAPTSMAAELCLLVANRLLRENKDEEGNLKKVAAKGLRLARLADSKIKDKDGNVKLHIANGMNESVLEALEELASRLNVFLQTEEKTTGKSCLDVKLPPSYVVPPKRASNVLLSGLTS